jgi:hypothetical protein
MAQLLLIVLLARSVLQYPRSNSHIAIVLLDRG